MPALPAWICDFIVGGVIGIMSDISIGNYTGALYDVYNSDNTSSGSKLQKTLTDKEMKEATEEELMDACKEFEAYFTEQVFKAMEKTVSVWSEGNEDSSSKYKDYATETLMQEYASQAASQNGGLGLAQMLYEQMKVNYNL